MPGLKEMRVIRAMGGVRPYPPDSKPLIGYAKGVPGMFIAAGHEGDGISMAPTTGRLISELIAGEEPYLDLTPFSFNRYKRRA